MLLFILWRDTTSELWTLVQFFYIVITVLLLLSLFILLQTITFYHSIRLILCSQQIGEIDNLIISWDKVLDCVVCRFHIVVGEKLHDEKFPGTIVRSVAKLAGINLRKFGSFSYWFDKPWFHNWGKLAAVLIITFTWGFPTSFLVSTTHQQNSNQAFWRHCRGERRFLQGESLTSNLLFCYCFLYFIFTFIILSKIQKKLVPLIACILLLLILVHYVVP
jgi:hypothetical protein